VPESVGPHRGHRVPCEVIAHAVRLDLRFAPSFRDVEELLGERGVTASYETARRRAAWVSAFDANHAIAIVAYFADDVLSCRNATIARAAPSSSGSQRA
jgi:hypothetical protein